MSIEPLNRQNKKISSIIQSALNAVDPYRIVKKRIQLNSKSISVGDQKIELKEIGQIFLIGIGKASLPMAKGAIDRLGVHIGKGVVVPKHIDQDGVEFPIFIKITPGDHPFPTRRSVNAAKSIVDCLMSTTENDLVIGLISGGASSLVTMPRDPVEIDQINDLTHSLLRSGASIDEINTIRKHLDLIKGGGLLGFINPARSINLILSDVIGDDLSVIASGPTSPDPSLFKDAIDILAKYELWAAIDGKIREVLSNGAEGKIPETLKKDDPLMTKTSNQIISSLSIAVEGARRKAQSLGYNTEIYHLKLMGEARDRGKELAQYLIRSSGEGSFLDKPLCIIAGGETTVTVTGKGKGGRNQELALGAALELDGSDNLKILTLATDGEDGPTDAAGAIVDGQTIQIAKQKGLDAQNYLANNDVYNFFDQTGGLIKTGPTGTNVNDLVLMFAET